MAFDFAAVRKGFFTSPGVVAQLGTQKRKAFSKAGAFIRTRARQSIRRKKGSAPPGRPPHAHAAGNSGIKLIFFAWDAAAESVVVGPVRFDSAKGPKGGAALLEKGGEATARDGKGRPRKYRYRGNPFMAPAVAAELPKFAGLFRSSPGG